MRKQLVRLFTSERAVVFVILLNTAALIALGYADPALAGPADWLSRQDLTTTFKVGYWVDYLCVIYFIIECVVKISTQGWRGYWNSGWNRFDFAVILSSTPMLLAPVLDVHQFSVLLVLRLGRLFRLFRVMRFIPNREHIYQGLQRAMKASVGVLLALMLINVVLALGATQLFGRVAPEYFGNPAISAYSMFRVFTVEGWYEIPDAIALKAHPAIAVLARIYFTGAVLVGGLLGISLANAVFVDEMTMDNNRDLEDKVDLLVAEISALRGELGLRTAAAEVPAAPTAAPTAEESTEG